MAIDAGTKTRIKAAKLDHDLHIALLMRREGLSKPDAIVLAYLDGLLGLNDRLNPPSGATVPAKP